MRIQLEEFEVDPGELGGPAALLDSTEPEPSPEPPQPPEPELDPQLAQRLDQLEQQLGGIDDIRYMVEQGMQPAQPPPAPMQPPELPEYDPYDPVSVAAHAQRAWEERYGPAIGEMARNVQELQGLQERERARQGQEFADRAMSEFKQGQHGFEKLPQVIRDHLPQGAAAMLAGHLVETGDGQIEPGAALHYATLELANWANGLGRMMADAAVEEYKQSLGHAARVGAEPSAGMGAATPVSEIERLPGESVYAAQGRATLAGLSPTPPSSA